MQQLYGQKKMKTIFLSILCVMMSGCFVQSLNQFYTDDLKVVLPLIVGEWISEIQPGENVVKKNINPWKFSEEKIETYDTENKYSELEAVYFKINDNLFMDFTAGEPLKDAKEFANPYWLAGVTSTHSLCKVFLKENDLEIIPADFEWLKDMIKENKLNLSYVRVAADNYYIIGSSERKVDKDYHYIFTGSSEEWVTFLKKYASNKGLFNEENKFVFRRMKPKNGLGTNNGK